MFRIVVHREDAGFRLKVTVEVKDVNLRSEVCSEGDISNLFIPRRFRHGDS